MRVQNEAKRWWHKGKFFQQMSQHFDYTDTKKVTLNTEILLHALVSLFST